MNDERIYPKLDDEGLDFILNEYFKCLRRLTHPGASDNYSYALAELRYCVPFIWELDEIGHKAIGDIRKIEALEDKVREFIIRNEITKLPKNDSPILTLFKLQVCK